MAIKEEKVVHVGNKNWSLYVLRVGSAHQSCLMQGVHTAVYSVQCFSAYMDVPCFCIVHTRCVGKWFHSAQNQNVWSQVSNTMLRKYPCWGLWCMWSPVPQRPGRPCCRLVCATGDHNSTCGNSYPLTSKGGTQFQFWVHAASGIPAVARCVQCVARCCS